MGGLAEQTALDQSTLSHIQRLEHDNRSMMVALTKQGEALAQRCWTAAKQHDALDEGD